MKEKLNTLIKEFLDYCKDGSSTNEGYRYSYKPSFKSFAAWLDDNPWKMEKES